MLPPLAARLVGGMAGPFQRAATELFDFLDHGPGRRIDEHHALA
jgi:hypothetical protein